MALVTKKAIFLHIMKTGGPRLYLHIPKELFDNASICVFVRHPIRWYQSLWAFNMRHGWQAELWTNVAYANNDFRLFVQSSVGYDVTKEQLDGYEYANRSMIGNMPGRYWARYSSELYDDVMEAERDVISRYYSDYELNKDDFIGEQPY